MSQRPQEDNVIYANFGSRTRVSGPTEVSKSTPRRPRPAMAPAAQLLIDVVTNRADSGRLTRGRQYATGGHVVSLEILSGRVHGQVAGSQNEPFNVTIQLPYRSTDDIAGVAAELARTPNGLRRARQGEVSESLLEVLLAEDLDDIRLLCDCPDSAPVCKHKVAVVEKLAAKIDADPLMLFELRGMNLVSLEQAVMAQAQNASRESESDPEKFWTGRDFPDLPNPKVAPALEDSDLDLLHKAMRTISYTNIEQLRAVSDLEDLYDHLCRGGVLDLEP
ncbi:hypothetical protein [Corynebacterium alimapuense]|uniref:SWIM-type domain-containing protein n=1 Tax=Corynebacterium alimapuense TaxID=1576874 RepID=A0A3M8K6P4_9CORY|nr:hypothetical protein [Corynebacterium alimapuense]RNE48425.1 hypothetical protein C5L39_07905 [Corynebacterium alimapuense]